MLAFWTIAVITFFALGYGFHVAREGYYMQCLVISIFYWVLTVNYFYYPNKLMFLTVFIITVGFTMMTVVAFAKRTNYNKRMVKRYEKLGKWDEKGSY